MSEAGTTITPESAVEKLMDESGIETVAVIDDVFAGPLREDYKSSEFEEFWAEIQDDDKAVEELSRLGLSLRGPDDITRDVLHALVENRQNLDRLKPSFEKYFAQTFEAKLKPVTKLCDCLEKDLHRKVVKHDGMTHLDDSSVRLIFLDYFLEEGSKARSIQKARRIAEEIQKRYTTDVKPLILLMSSKPITPDMIASMREGARFLGSMFEFMPKDLFGDPLKLIISLGFVAKSLQERQRIQQFVESVENSISGAVERLRESIQGLSYEDYAYIQRLSLQREGHPLGDYISWLYSAYFGHLLFHSITQREVLDGLTFTKLAATSFEPSLQFVEIYKNIVTEVVGPVKGHPRDKRAEEDDSPPLLHFGDVFFHDGTDVLMVISAECDLAFTPDDEHRPFDPERGVLLIPGSLCSQGQAVEDHRLKTVFFAHKNETKRIIWHPKNVLSIPYGQIRDWLSKNGYRREARLRLPFALEIQQAFASGLTRIGMPVGPPICELATVEIACEGKENQTEVLSKLTNAAFIFHARKDEFVLSRTCIVQLPDVIDKAVKVLEQAKQSHVEKGRTTHKHDSHIAEIKALKSSFAALLELSGPFELPTKRKPLKNLPIEIHRNEFLEGNYHSPKALIFNIVDATPSVVPEVEAEISEPKHKPKNSAKDR